MWKYIRQYLLFAIIAGLFMMGEVLMDLIQPGIMGRIVDDGVLGVHSRGTPRSAPDLDAWAADDAYCKRSG